MIVITTLAEYQTHFWIKVAKSLEKKGHKIVILSFDDRSCDLIDENHLTYYNVPNIAKASVNSLDIEKSLEKYGIDDVNYWISHERVTFALKDSQKMIARLIGYADAVNKIFLKLKKEEDKIILIQELGGFISVISTFFAARKNKINNIFLEPSFFKGRLFSLLNSFDAPKITNQENITVSLEVKEYLSSTIDDQTIVIPRKDAHQYTGALFKVFNFSNFKRAIKKIFDKFLLKKHQEFGHIGHYIFLHLKMLFNAVSMNRSYRQLESLSNIIYFPFHVPGDMALTLRSPEYFDQLSFVEYLLKIIPSNYILVVKEHPAQIGGIDASRLKGLLSQFDNLVIINPSKNNYEVLKKANLIISINSKSGVEAASLGKPSIVMGDAFYKDSPLVKPVNSLFDLKAIIKESLENWIPENKTQREIYFQNVWYQTYPGELYIEDKKDIEIFSCSLLEISKNL